jgi:hypothetical protein
MCKKDENEPFLVKANYPWGTNRSIRKPLDFDPSGSNVNGPGLYSLLLNQAAPNVFEKTNGGRPA